MLLKIAEIVCFVGAYLAKVELLLEQVVAVVVLRDARLWRIVDKKRGLKFLPVIAGQRDGLDGLWLSRGIVTALPAVLVAVQVVVSLFRFHYSLASVFVCGRRRSRRAGIAVEFIF
jgi:hypothetical protein